MTDFIISKVQEPPDHYLPSSPLLNASPSGPWISVLLPSHVQECLWAHLRLSICHTATRETVLNAALIVAFLSLKGLSGSSSSLGQISGLLVWYTGSFGFSHCTHHRSHVLPCHCTCQIVWGEYSLPSHFLRPMNSYTSAYEIPYLLAPYLSISPSPHKMFIFYFLIYFFC